MIQSQIYQKSASTLVFAICLIFICFTGLFTNKGKLGLIGTDDIELVTGITIPILFL